MALNKNKTDPVLGKKVNDYLTRKGINTPVNESHLMKDSQEKIDLIQAHTREIWTTLGMDLSDDSLIDTPKRIAKMFVDELYWGLLPENFPKCTTIDNKMDYDEMIVEKDVTIMSNCEHHGVVIDGLARIGYIPNKKVLGLSKINRIADYFARRPQVQERLTEQIFYALEYILETSNVAVVVEATHYCVRSRGVQDYNSSTKTSKLGGLFKEESALRMEFLQV